MLPPKSCVCVVEVSQGTQQRSSLRTRFVLFAKQVSSEIHNQLRYILLERSLDLESLYSEQERTASSAMGFTMPSRRIDQIITI
jgi:hypothetical protein